MEYFKALIKTLMPGSRARQEIMSSGKSKATFFGNHAKDAAKHDPTLGKLLQNAHEAITAVYAYVDGRSETSGTAIKAKTEYRCMIPHCSIHKTA